MVVPSKVSVLVLIRRCVAIMIVIHTLPISRSFTTTTVLTTMLINGSLMRSMEELLPSETEMLTFRSTLSSEEENVPRRELPTFLSSCT